MLNGLRGKKAIWKSPAGEKEVTIVAGYSRTHFLVKIGNSHKVVPKINLHGRTQSGWANDYQLRV